jgi:hypothetical protein
VISGIGVDALDLLNHIAVAHHLTVTILLAVFGVGVEILPISYDESAHVGQKDSVNGQYSIYSELRTVITI